MEGRGDSPANESECRDVDTASVRATGRLPHPGDLAMERYGGIHLSACPKVYRIPLEICGALALDVCEPLVLQ